MSIVTLLLNNLSSRPVTLRFPQRPPAAPGYRGTVIYDAEKCTGCGMCAFRCTSRAIEFRNTRTHMIWSYDPGQCTYCGRCVDGCADHAITQSAECPAPYCDREAVKFSKTSPRKEKKLPTGDAE
ncbi:MAG TPA: 4Fe-4S binding protein [candidate division Zixibacteria bacterium]|jgi:hydrogenase-4 component H|nr:4Fe-4S binding protein [candidate division Zixibacteria bacterium]